MELLVVLWMHVGVHFLGGEQKDIEGGEPPLLWPSTKSGGGLIQPPPKFKEGAFAPLQEGRGIQVCCCAFSLNIPASLPYFGASLCVSAKSRN